MTSRRAVGDPWYTTLYREPARFWWLTPLVGAGAVLGTGWAMRGLSSGLAMAVGWLAVSLPLYGWQWRRDKRRAERDAATD